MDKEGQELLAKLLTEAEQVRDDELRDADIPIKERDEPRGRLEPSERRIYTVMLRRLEAMNALVKQTDEAKASGQVTKEFRKKVLDEFVALTEEQSLLNVHLSDLLHERLGIPAHLGIAVRRGGYIIEVPMLDRPQPTVIRVEEAEDDPAPPDDDPLRWN